jgi:ribonuclease D
MTSANTPQPSTSEDATANLPLLELRDGLSDVIDDEPALTETVEAFRSGTGPVAVDAERASGYRYSHRAYLVQLRREGTGSALVDPIPFGDLAGPEHTVDVEMRASWTAEDAHLDRHLLAWLEVLGNAAGLPPPGVHLLGPSDRGSSETL